MRGGHDVCGADDSQEIGKIEKFNIFQFIL